MFSSKIALLPKESLVQTSEVDHADWNYRPILGTLQRARFHLIKKLLRDTSCSDLLEVGYGSGVFFPELMKHTRNISGIDIHEFPEEVTAKVADAGIKADLHAGSVCEMPFADNSMDVVVAVSALEYVEEIDVACLEIKRVLRDGGFAAIVTPNKSPILDFGLKILGGEDADGNYGNRRERMAEALERHFDVAAIKRWPWPGLPWFTVYRAYRLLPKDVV